MTGSREFDEMHSAMRGAESAPPRPPGPAPLGGSVDDRFTGLRELFERRVGDGEELGASFFLLLHGESVVDLWGGWADVERTRPWERDTLATIWSLSKTITTLAALVLIDRGQLDLHAPVAAYWPEFAAAGKEAITVRNVIKHSSGVSGWKQPITAARCSTSRRRRPVSPRRHRGGRRERHPAILLDFGHLVGEIVRRIDGRGPGLDASLSWTSWARCRSSSERRRSTRIETLARVVAGQVPATASPAIDGSMRIFACVSGSPSAVNAPSTPSRPTRPVTRWPTSSLPSASA